MDGYAPSLCLIVESTVAFKKIPTINTCFMLLFSFAGQKEHLPASARGTLLKNVVVRWKRSEINSQPL